ncbi:hypothetical protein [Polaribacter sp. Asnod6-C07]|uniref:hypothetical protein n=1 Tax=Polaribacter sp. Asnod6-C07 TaxID=3160582 RepID=UPI00386BF542
MKQNIIIVLILFLSISVKAQFNVIQDGEGETSFQLFQSNTISLNTEKTSLGFSITPKKIVNNKGEKYWTITGSANAKKGSSDLFKGGEFQFSGKIGANLIFDKTNYGNRDNPGDGNLIYSFLGAEFLYSRNNVFDSTKDFDNQIFDQTNIGLRINYGWNFQNIKLEGNFFKFLGEFTAGISGSIGVKDNTDILSQKEIVTSSETITNGTTVRTLSTTSDVYEVDKLISNQKFSRLNLDFGKHFFKQRFFANAHLTYAIDEELKPVLNPSFGIFVIQKGAPLEAILGIQIQTSDWSNNRASKKDRWERSSIVLTAGFPFN